MNCITSIRVNGKVEYYHITHTTKDGAKVYMDAVKRIIARMDKENDYVIRLEHQTDNQSRPTILQEVTIRTH